MSTAAATVRRDGDALVFAGALTRDAVRGLWTAIGAQRAGLRRLDLRAVTAIDSAGLALLSLLAGGDAAAGDVAVEGDPPGLAELRSAYRLYPALAFASAQ